jgi:hypothetical protein
VSLRPRLALEVFTEPVDLGRSRVFDVTPHEPIQVRVPNSSLAANDSPIRDREPLDDLLGVHTSQYTYPSRICKTHMYIPQGQYGGMTKNPIRQTLARNVADRMHRNPAFDTQAKLSARSGVAQPHISRILRGTSAATVDRVARLASAFACQPWELLVDTELTRQAALQRMILGETAPDARVSAALPPPPTEQPRPPKRVATKTVKRR